MNRIILFIYKYGYGKRFHLDAEHLKIGLDRLIFTKMKILISMKIKMNLAPNEAMIVNPSEVWSD